MNQNNGATMPCCHRSEVGNQENVATVQPESTGKVFAPRVDIVETPDALFLHADLPGAKPENIDLRFEHGELTLCGKVQPRPRSGRQIFSEYDVGDFCRTFQVSDEVDASKIEADYKNGVLTVRLPKHQAVQPKLVPIRVQA